MDIHLYPVTIPPEIYGKDLAQCRRKMQDRGQAKPVWLTEFGCYADDDPYRTPSVIGDSAMSRANRRRKCGIPLIRSRNRLETAIL